MRPSAKLLLASLALCLAAAPLRAGQTDDDVKKLLKEAGKGAKGAPAAPGGPAAAAALQDVTKANYNGLAKNRLILAVYSEAVKANYEAKAKPALAAAASKHAGRIAVGAYKTDDNKELHAALKDRYSGAGCLRPTSDTSPDLLPVFLLIENGNLAAVTDPPTEGERVEKCCFNATSVMKGDKDFAARLDRFVKACFPAEKKK